MTLLRIIGKVSILFLLLNALFAALNPVEGIGQISIYNRMIPGRVRLPYGEDQRAYNLSLNSLTAMFASHEIVRPKTSDEFRVVILGDSSVWGILLQPGETLSAYLNAADLRTDNNQRIVAYNLGHPILSLTKDLLILDRALQYEPDLIVWAITLRSFPRSHQFDAPLVQNNAAAVRQLFVSHNLDYDLNDARLVDKTFLDRTIVGQRRPLADWLRLQLHGVMWGITGIDQLYPDEIALRTSDFDNDVSWNEILEPRPLTTDDLSFDIIQAGHDQAAATPLLLVNEPIYISNGENSDLRYNLWYPRWTYDAYRALLNDVAEQSGWDYIDLWDLIDPNEFTDSPVHLTPAGSQQLAIHLSHEVERIIRRNNHAG